ncbi:hypothetical protein CO669_25255 [Bradyrhizobium sp. Y36]|nr:hypothetical protein CO669_25255 [Bradyrhizobium sp. Y36]
MEAVQHAAGSDFEMKIVAYEMLVQEEKKPTGCSRSAHRVAAGANAYSASRVGYGRYTGAR